MVDLENNSEYGLKELHYLIEFLVDSTWSFTQSNHEVIKRLHLNRAKKRPNYACVIDEDRFVHVC